MSMTRVLRLLASVALLLIAIRVVVATSLSAPGIASLLMQLNQPVPALLHATGNALGLTSGIVALVVCAQRGRWRQLFLMLLLVLACIYVPTVALTIGPSQRWWNPLSSPNIFLPAYLASTLAAPAVTALVTLALTLWGEL